MQGFSTDMWAMLTLPSAVLGQTTTPETTAPSAQTPAPAPAPGAPAPAAQPPSMSGTPTAPPPSTQDLISGSAGTAAPGTGTGAGPLGGTGAAGGGVGGQQSPFGGSFIFIMIALMGFMLLTSVLSARKEKRRQADLLSALKPGDRVLAAGGLLAQVDRVKDDEVILKIDENSSVKMKVLRSSVQQILKPSETTAESK